MYNNQYRNHQQFYKIPDFLRVLSMNIYLFVYGTLITGNENHHYLSEETFLTNCELNNFTMYELGGYPGIKPQHGSRVKGELYVVKPDTILRLDFLEDEGLLYKRTSVQVVDSDGRIYRALTYVYIPKIHREKEITYHNQPYRCNFVR
jgi:gamma-glutamylcyclotransferase (GGCT)/AIG2-like uncharacterized protein YtfP